MGSCKDDLDIYHAQEAASWMEHVRHLGILCRARREEIERLRSLALPHSALYSDTPRSPNVYIDAIPDAVSKLNEEITEYCEELAGFVDERHAAHKAVDQLSSPIYRGVLTSYYLSGRTWREVCEKTGYSHRHMMEIRLDALASLWEHMPLEYKTRPPEAL